MKEEYVYRHTLGNYQTMQNKNFSLFVHELNNVRRNLCKCDTKEIFEMEWRGHKFNCFPFLLNGTSFLDYKFRTYLCGDISRTNKTVEPVYEDELRKDKWIDWDAMDSMIVSQEDFGIKDMCAWHFQNHPRAVINILFVSYVYVLQDCILDNDWRHKDFKCEGICNTQAFGFYLGVAWVLSLSKFASKLIVKELKRTKFWEILDSLCPEGCIHDRYIKGEITGKELHKLYMDKSYPDGSSICIREVISNNTEGEYDGSDLTANEIGFAEDYHRMISSNLEYRLNMHLAYCLLFDGTYEEMNKSIENTKADAEKMKIKTDKAEARMNIARGEIIQLKGELQKKDDEIQSLKRELDKRPSSKELQSAIADLKTQLGKLESENSRLFDERLKLRQEISIYKKKLRGIDTDSSVVEESSKTSGVVDKFDLNKAIDVLKDKRYTIVGGDFVKGLNIKLDEYGFNFVKYATKNTKNLGMCDYVILITKMCCHSDVYHVEKLIKNSDSVLVYFNGANADQLIKQLYELEVELC